MDAILKSTIRVTKCLLSYGVVQENVEKIILEAYAEEIERYPVLYEENIYLEGAWRKTKNCTVCEVVITEFASQCFSCSKNVCRFCLKNKCCPNCNDYFDQKCGICKDIPSIPVSCYLEKCRCNNLYCLTCLRDSLGMNGGEIVLTSCFKCGEKIDPPHPHAAGRHIYGIPQYSTHFLDAKHGEISCPRKCGEKMLRVNAQAHLQVCPNAKKRYE